MQTVYYIIRDNGDGSQSVEWYKGSQFDEEKLVEACENDKYDSYQSGDGVQIRTLEFPDNFDLNSIVGIVWRTDYPESYSYWIFNLNLTLN